MSETSRRFDAGSTPNEAAACPVKLPERPVDANKGTFGRAVLVGGSRGMSGAIRLSGLGTLRSGAGLVFLGVPESIADLVAASEPAYQVRSLPEDDAGRLCHAAQGELEALLEKADAVGIGPGLGRSADLDQLAMELFTNCSRPLVFDADALNALAAHRQQDEGWLRNDSGFPRVLTPHPGEFARLTGHSVETILADRRSLALEFARQTKTILVLKGHRTLISDGVDCFENSTGNSGMATGGTGDVLTGVVTSLLAQGMPALEATRLAVFVHGRAGDLAAADLSARAMIASDLPRYLANAWLSLEAAGADLQE